jgi:hypothetical protein
MLIIMGYETIFFWTESWTTWANKIIIYWEDQHLLQIKIILFGLDDLLIKRFKFESLWEKSQ